MTEFYELFRAPRISWVPMVTLVFLLAGQPWRHYRSAGSGARLFGLITAALTACGLIVPDLGYSPWLWLGLVCSYSAWIASVYYFADNHHYLIGYWCVAVALALIAHDPDEVLRRSATVLVGTCFGLAVLAKMLNRDYRDSTFFTWLLIFDPRVRLLATMVGGLTSDVFRRHATAFGRIWMGVSPGESAEVPRSLRRLALGLTWWTVGIEAIVAAAFLWPGDGLDSVRVTVLMAFAVTTFTFVAVPFFGQILLLMLLAATNSAEVRVIVVMLAAFLTVVSFVPEGLRSARRVLKRRNGLAVAPPESKPAQLS